MPDHVFRDTGLPDLHPEFQQFTEDPRRAPERIRFRHRANQDADIGRQGRSTNPATTFPRPECAEASAMPGDDCLGCLERLASGARHRQTRHPYPEQAVGLRQTQPPGAGPLHYVELVPQREHLELQGGA
jgi:hypothetical protein